jgi:hypothetical protein
MTNEIKVTEVWCKPEEDGSPNYLDTSRSFVEGDRRVVLVWKDDYDAMRRELELNVKAIHGLQEQCSQLRDKYAAANRELEEWRQFKEKNKAMWQGAVKLVAEDHD